MILTREQREALYRVYLRRVDSIKNNLACSPGATGIPSYREFRRTATMASYDNCVMVPYPEANIWLGIEPDGYTHS